jgi:hypothetical protein
MWLRKKKFSDGISLNRCLTSFDMTVSIHFVWQDVVGGFAAHYVLSPEDYVFYVMSNEVRHLKFSQLFLTTIF